MKMPEDDDTISIDFSKIKKFFKKNKSETSRPEAIGSSESKTDDKEETRSTIDTSSIEAKTQEQPKSQTSQSSPSKDPIKVATEAQVIGRSSEPKKSDDDEISIDFFQRLRISLKRIKLKNPIHGQVLIQIQ